MHVARARLSERAATRRLCRDAREILGAKDDAVSADGRLGGWITLALAKDEAELELIVEFQFCRKRFSKAAAEPLQRADGFLCQEFGDFGTLQGPACE